MENVVLFGNGLNLLSNNLSWHDLLDKILHKGLEGKATSVCIPSALPNTLQYDFILFNSYSVGKSIVEERQLILKKCIADNVKHFATNDIYKFLGELKVDTYLTTNYDHTLDESLRLIGYVPDLSKSNKQEKLYNIRRSRAFSKSGDTKIIYPIHGYIDNPKSIVIGYNHYCGTIGKLDAYLKGRAEWEGKPLPKMEKRFYSEDFAVKSWIDHFFFSNVHILGLGLDFSEIDLWWILDRRKRLIMEGCPIKNHIIFYDIVKKDVSSCDDKDLSREELKFKAKYEIFAKMDVEKCIYEVEKNDYNSSYRKAIGNIEKCISNDICSRTNGDDILC